MRLPLVVLALALLPAAAQSQTSSFEGSKWSIEQEGVETPALWWFGSQGRVRTGDVGTILPGYKWRQSGDSIFVTVGDTLRYNGQLISNRFVGIRTGRNRQEGWWSGSRADAPAAPAAVAVAPEAAAATTAAVPESPKPTSTGAATEQMSRPVEPTSPAATTTGAPRTLRRIERADGSAPQGSSGNSGGQEIHRIQRGATLPATTPVPRQSLVGRWVQADSGGVITSIEFKDDGSTYVGLNTGNKGEGQWSNEAEGTRVVIGGARREAVIRVWQEGEELRLLVETASGSPVTRRFRRAG